MRIIDRLYEIMERQGKTQKGLADHLGISKSTINYWFKKSGEIPCDYLPQICQYLNVSVGRLIMGEEDASPKEPEKVDLPEDEEQLLQIFRTLDLEGRTLVLAEAYKHRARLSAQGNTETNAAI